ncbi:hypothetical protein C8R46DRAFT_1132120 [Mycena filopes]|nr:hypothetical protein C8R46DRAFT_1132120 [Mycena filopes]
MEGAAVTFASVISVIASLASIGSLAIGDIPDAIEKLEAKKWGPGGELGKLIVDLAVIRATIVDKADYVEKDLLINWRTQYHQHLSKATVVRAEWNAVPLRKRISKYCKHRKDHSRLREPIEAFRTTVVAVSDAAEFAAKVEQALARDSPHPHPQSQQDVGIHTSSAFSLSAIAFPEPIHMNELIRGDAQSEISNPFADPPEVAFR